MRSREVELYLKMYPKLKRWLNQCVGCRREGYRPEMPARIYPGVGVHADHLRTLFGPLNLDDRGLCDQCSAARSDSN
jgi:hypothetical protein